MSNELRKLERARIIELGSRRIVVVDVSALQTLVRMGERRGRYTTPRGGDDEENSPTAHAKRRTASVSSRLQPPEAAIVVTEAMKSWDRAVLRERHSERTTLKPGDGKFMENNGKEL